MRVPISKRLKLLLENPKTAEQLLRATSLARRPENGKPDLLKVDDRFNIKLVRFKDLETGAKEPADK
jgi:hypothetical protein